MLGCLPELYPSVLEREVPERTLRNPEFASVVTDSLRGREKFNQGQLSVLLPENDYDAAWMGEERSICFDAQLKKRSRPGLRCWGDPACVFYFLIIPGQALISCRILFGSVVNAEQAVANP